MHTTHTQPDGTWALCPTPDVCDLPFHFPGMTPAMMADVPADILWEMCQLVDPPTIATMTTGSNTPISYAWWDAEDRKHRDYDLPAIVHRDGGAEWYRAGVRHRAGGRPAVMYANGTVEHWEAGVLLHASDPVQSVRVRTDQIRYRTR